MFTCHCSSGFPSRSAQLRSEQPSFLKGDNLYKFTCCDCSEDGKEAFDRMRLTWQQVRHETLKRCTSSPVGSLLIGCGLLADWLWAPC